MPSTRASENGGRSRWGCRSSGQQGVEHGKAEVAGLEEEPLVAGRLSVFTVRRICGMTSCGTCRSARHGADDDGRCRARRCVLVEQVDDHGARLGRPCAGDRRRDLARARPSRTTSCRGRSRSRSSQRLREQPPGPIAGGLAGGFSAFSMLTFLSMAAELASATLRSSDAPHGMLLTGYTGTTGGRQRCQSVSAIGVDGLQTRVSANGRPAICQTDRRTVGSKPQGTGRGQPR